MVGVDAVIHSGRERAVTNFPDSSRSVGCKKCTDYNAHDDALLHQNGFVDNSTNALFDTQSPHWEHSLVHGQTGGLCSNRRRLKLSHIPLSTAFGSSPFRAKLVSFPLNDEDSKGMETLQLADIVSFL